MSETWTPPHWVANGRWWSPDEVETMLSMADQRSPIKSIAKTLRRSPASVYCKALYIGRPLGPLKVANPESVGSVIKEIADQYGLTPRDLAGPNRERRVSWPRQRAMWALSKRTRLNLSGIGRRLGGRDHSTVIYGIRAHERRMAEEQA